MKKSRIGVLTGGGDCAGLNSALKWVVKTALDERLARARGIKHEIWGIRDGFKGLACQNPFKADPDEHVIKMNEELVRTWDRYGGTMLGTSRYSPYDAKHYQADLVIKNIAAMGLDVLIVIGGNGTLSIASRLSQEGVNVIGIPKTIDRDLPETDYTLGFDTALNVIVEEIDRLRTTAGSHKRIFVVETMGRSAGWLALEGGEASGAYLTLIPEWEFSIDRVNELILEGKRKGARYEIILVAEGARPLHGKEIVKSLETDGFGQKLYGGVAEFLASEIQQETGLETRGLSLSHLQRGGSPSALDRKMGRYFGIAAVEMAVMKTYGHMVVQKNGVIATHPLKDVIGRLNLVDPKTQYDTDRYGGRRTVLGRPDKYISGLWR
ncbi:MAG TPA: ATP-dependent 6-phosphofructokinase [Dehalococcoidales bacterium]|nr:ATP-dependent 6-phosphofructokinase [Dehalococcoidales bacterium]